MNERERSKIIGPKIPRTIFNTEFCSLCGEHTQRERKNDESNMISFESHNKIQSNVRHENRSHFDTCAKEAAAKRAYVFILIKLTRHTIGIVSFITEYVYHFQNAYGKRF